MPDSQFMLLNKKDAAFLLSIFILDLRYIPDTIGDSVLTSNSCTF